MTGIPGSTPHPGRDRLARAWAQAVCDTSYIAMDRTELVAYLRRLTDQMADALTGEPFRAGPANRIGRALADARVTGPRALGATLEVLDSRLLPDLAPELDDALDAPEQYSRRAALLGEIAAGYSGALVDRTRDEQEGIRTAAITALEEAQRARRASDARFRAVFAGAATGIAVADLAGAVVEANEALARMLGHTVPELRRRSVYDFLHPSDPTELGELYRELVIGQRDQFRIEKRLLRRDGSDIWTDMSVSVVREEPDRPRYVVVMVHDITERERLHQRLRHQALHDPLTQLPNRMQFLDRLHHAFETAGPGDRIALCYIDLDGFKAVNDNLGHDIGDELLLRLANRLHDRLAPAGHLVARVGGDEFAVLVGAGTGTAAVDVARSVSELVRHPVDVGCHRLRVTASIGVVERDPGDTDPGELMKAADITLYRAKAGGRDRCALYDRERDNGVVVRQILATTMPAALSADEFLLEYQPIVGLESGLPIGAEALLRWQHPRYGRLGPDRFVPLAEETGLIHEIGRWVLRQACQQAAGWTAAHPRLSPLVSVNVSACQLSDRRLVDDLREILATAGLPAHRLQLELTRYGDRFADPGLHATMRTLVDNGVRIIADDFGSGHSNLECLRALPVHGLKIAGRFIEALHPDRPASPVTVDIVQTVVGLAERLGLSVTAQHIETEGQVRQLRAMGCRAGQGHYFAPPGPAGAFDQMLGAAESLAAGGPPQIPSHRVQRQG
ncbi:MAG TPA: EAL domain-containing protein [Micromonosporaceae bacterium]